MTTWCLQCGKQAIFYADSIDPRFPLVVCRNDDDIASYLPYTVGTTDKAEASAATDRWERRQKSVFDHYRLAQQFIKDAIREYSDIADIAEDIYKTIEEVKPKLAKELGGSFDDIINSRLEDILSVIEKEIGFLGAHIVALETTG